MIVPMVSDSSQNTEGATMAACMGPSHVRHAGIREPSREFGEIPIAMPSSIGWKFDNGVGVSGETPRS